MSAIVDGIHTGRCCGDRWKRRAVISRPSRGDDPWESSSSTQLLTMRGALSLDGKKLTLHAEMDEPMLGIRGRLIKCETEYVNDDTQIFRVFDLAVNETYKVLEMEYRRRK